MKTFKDIREGKRPGLWANIHAKRKRGEKMRKKGEKGAPALDAFDKIRKGRQNKIIKKSIPLSKKNLKKFSAVILVTDHDQYDYEYIAQNSKIIFDTRGAYKKFAFKNIFYC